MLIQDAGTETSQVNANKIRVSPINVVNSDNVGVWGYASYLRTDPAATYTNDTAVRKINLVSGAWATVNGVDLLAALR